MKIAYHYGSLAGGGVERRMGDLYRHLTRRGDEVWIVGLSWAPGGQEILCGSGGVPEERIIVAPIGTSLAGDYHLWSHAVLQDIAPDIIDVQWCATPMEYPATAIATVHGQIPLPTPDLVQGFLFISGCILPPPDSRIEPFCVVDNWVDLDEYPFHEDLPDEGVCFLGREYKAKNADAVAGEWDGSVDCYSDQWTEEHSSGMVYKGYGDPREVLPRYRVVFASGMAAMEAMAMGRLVIVGQPSRFTVEDCRLALPDRMWEMSASLFAFAGARGEVEPPSQAQRMQEFEAALAPGDRSEERLAVRSFLAAHHNAEVQIGLVREFYEKVLASG